MSNFDKNKSLPDTATDSEKKHHLANLKQIYGLRKDISEIKHSIDDIAVKIDSRCANMK